MNHVTSDVSKRKNHIILTLFSLLMGTMIIAQAYLLVTIIDGVFLGDKTFRDILPLLAGLLMVLFARVLFGYLNGRKGIQMGARQKETYRQQLVEKYSGSSVQSSLIGQSGKKVSMIMDAVDEVDSYYSEYIPQIIQSAIIPMEIIIVIFMTHANSGWIMLITTPFIPIFMIIIGMQTKKKSEERLDELGAFSGKFLDVLQGLVTLKLFGRARQQQETIKDSSLGFREATMSILKVAFTNSFMLELISMLSIGIIALEVALQLILFDGITFFGAFFILLLAPEFYTALKQLGNAFHNGKSSMGAVEKITEELNKQEKPVEWGDMTLDTDQTAIEIKLSQVNFRYGEEETFALQNIDAIIPPYHHIAIVGPSGAGKSTLLHILSGIAQPTSGRVYANNQPLTHYREDVWFNTLSYISQDPYIFSGTIAENIAIGMNATQDVSRDAIAQAAENAGLARLIESLEHGYDTPVGEAGRGLSGGEKQRLALARAFLKKPSVILFDEPTTGLDLKTERILEASMESLAADATVITVAHRLHTIQNADKILYLDHGHLIGSGTHTELMQNIAAYKQMVALQGGDAS
ncbi:MAG TPA: thiol reductant ABC exporter subunit CydD [Virgibacillus sp.]|nr:thiol reductant ABC exporter subunit CydD [Virgibacillus sp.]